MRAVNFKRFRWPVGIALGVSAVLALAAREENRTTFGPDDSVADMIATLAADAQRKPSIDTFKMYRYRTESDRRIHWLRSLTLGLPASRLILGTASCDTVFYNQSRRELSHYTGEIGNQFFLSHLLTNVSRETLLAVGKEKGGWCSFLHYGSKDATSCHDQSRKDADKGGWNCCPG